LFACADAEVVISSSDLLLRRRRQLESWRRESYEHRWLMTRRPERSRHMTPRRPPSVSIRRTAFPFHLPPPPDTVLSLSITSPHVGKAAPPAPVTSYRTEPRTGVHTYGSEAGRLATVIDGRFHIAYRGVVAVWQKENKRRPMEEVSKHQINRNK